MIRVLFALALIVLSGIVSAESSTPPNIIIMLADDMGYGDVASQNPASKVPTPHIDGMAAQGMRFTDVHSPSAVCTPTRYGILTGTYCWRTALKSSVLWPWDRPLIAEDTLTLPAMLKEQGYATACIGKWHLGWNWATMDDTDIAQAIKPGVYDKDIRGKLGKQIDFTKPIGGGPTARGFDYYFGDDVPNFPPYCYIENDRTLGIPTVEKPKTMFGNPGLMLPDWDLTAVMPTITEKAVEYIRNAERDRPFFLYFPLTAPHTPIAPTDEFRGKSEAHRYGDFIMEVDWVVGQIQVALKASGQLENTLLIFTSDNGSPGRDGSNMAGGVSTVLKYGHNPSHIYRGTKADIWEGGHRVPFIAQWPGKIPEGQSSSELIGLQDLMATMATITGYDLPEGAAVDSRNVLPALLGEELDQPIRETLVHHSVGGMFAIRQGKWKYIQGQGSGGWSKDKTEADMKGQLYDLDADPGESRNLYKQEPEVVSELEAMLEGVKGSGNLQRQRHGL